MCMTGCGSVRGSFCSGRIGAIAVNPMRPPAMPASPMRGVRWTRRFRPPRCGSGRRICCRERGGCWCRRRMPRYGFAGIFPIFRAVVVPHEDDAALPPLRAQRGAGGRARICVIGAIGVAKGYDVLLACARDAARRNLPLEFVVVGHSIDDQRLIGTGRVFVTGEFRAGEAVALIQAQDADLALLAFDLARDLVLCADRCVACGAAGGGVRYRCAGRADTPHRSWLPDAAWIVRVADQ